MRHLAWLVLLASACSFPAVDYTDPPCGVPGACKSKPSIQACRPNADDALKTCLSMGCMADPACKAMCQDEFDADIQDCNHQCQVCAAEVGCKNAVESCAALFGP